MLKLKIALLIGFVAGWLVGSGRAAEFWDQFQGSRRVVKPAAAEPLDRTA